MERIKNLSIEKKLFYSFLLIHLVVWTVIGMIRTVLPTDSLEGIYWGSFADLGTNKHPPLAAWITYLAYMPFKSDFCVYLVSQLFIVTGFIYIYKLAKYFLDEHKSMLSVIILEGCWCYSYITGYYGFNPDVILLLMLPMIVYHFYNCVHFERKTDWLLLGLIVGIAFLNKYQTGLIIAAMAIWALIFKREIFKNIYFYIAIAIAFVIFLPHLLWLVHYDFFPFLYFGSELSANQWYQHILAPLNFFIMQMVAISGSLILYALLLRKTKTPIKIDKSHDAKDTWFILLIAFVPLVIHLIMGLLEGGTMRPRWGYEFWFMTGIVLFYFLPCKIEEKEFKFVVKGAYVLMLIVFLSLGTLLTVEKNYRSRYPVATIYNDMNKFWNEKYNTPMKYIGGYIEWTLPLTIYAESHPKCILDTFGYKDPWIDEDDKIKSGVMIIDRHPWDVERQTRKACPYLPNDYVIEPIEYKFFVHNALGMPREYTIHYFIVPPQK